MRMCGRRWCSRLFCCFLLPNCCSLPSIEVIFERLFPVVDFLIRRVLGRFLFVLVYSLLCFILLVVAAIVIPYESLHKPAWVMYILVVFASWITVNLFFHYTMACRIKPGSPQKSSQLPQCRTCKNHKPANAHHCSICNICVLNMDHHCIWINQCVGAANHRYFLQFVAFISLGCATFVVAASNTFYYNYWHAFTNNRMFCDSDLLAGRLPWFELVCAHGPTMIMSTIFFSYLLCAIVCLLVGALFYWNFVLISSGETYLGVLIHSVGCLPMLRMALFPCRSAHFRENWRRFLGLKRGGPTFFRHILFPSTHQALGYLNWDGQQPVEEQQKLLAAIV